MCYRKNTASLGTQEGSFYLPSPPRWRTFPQIQQYSLWSPASHCRAFTSSTQYCACALPYHIYTAPEYSHFTEMNGVQVSIRRRHPPEVPFVKAVWHRAWVHSKHRWIGSQGNEFVTEWAAFKWVGENPRTTLQKKKKKK